MDQYGNVTEATPGFEGTTVTDMGMWNAARTAAMKAHFSTSANAPVLQTGTISYVFLKSNKHQDDVVELRSLGYDHLRFKEVEITGNYRDFARKIEEKGCLITESSDLGVLLHGPFMGYPDALIIAKPLLLIMVIHIHSLLTPTRIASFAMMTTRCILGKSNSLSWKMNHVTLTISVGVFE